MPKIMAACWRVAFQPPQGQCVARMISYDGVGHAFWKDMGQIEREEMPQIAAWRKSTGFLRDFFERAS